MKYKKAHINIALLKYWGKRDQVLNIPNQTSISVTADIFYTLTNVTIDPALFEDVVLVDGVKLTGIPYVRVIQHLNKLRKYFNRNEFVKVTSQNHVFVKAGFASSASAFAALTAAYVAEIGAKPDEVELSRLARLGSGSAARSIHGGFVIWHKGHDHLSSYAESLPVDWPSLRLLFTFVSTDEKKISSRAGMQLSVEKAPSYKAFVEESDSLVSPLTHALIEKDLVKVGTMAERNAEFMRNVMLEAGLEYHTPKTQELIRRIKNIRSQERINVFYTFDAGPNLILLAEESDVNAIIKLLPDYKIEVSKVGGGISDEVSGKSSG